METRTKSLAQKEFVEFITSTPTLKQMAEFRISPEANARISYLLEANRNGTLSAEERVELDEYGHLEHIMRMVKIRAYERLDKSP